MKAERRAKWAVRLEQLEQRWLLSDSPGPSVDELLFAPKAPQVVDANTITSIVAAVLGSAPAGDPIFMQYEGIDGDVTVEGFEDFIQLNSFQWGVGRGISSPGSGRDREASAPSVSEIVVTKMLDSSSVPLIQEAFVGTPADVEINFVNIQASGESEIYLKLELENTLISGYSMSSGGDRPSESLSLNFTKISISALDIKGETQSFTFDLAKQGTSFLTAGAPQGSIPAMSQASAEVPIDPIYMKYEGIDGDVTAAGYEGATQLNSFQWGVGRGIGSPTGGADRPVSAPSVSEIVVTKSFDSSSVPLIQEAFIGDDAHVDVEFVNQFAQKLETYLKVELENTLVSSYSLSSGGDRPSESLSLNFTKISFAHTTQKEHEPHTHRFTYDLSKAQTASLLPAATSRAVLAASQARATASLNAGIDPIYMKYGDIEGDVTAAGYEGAMQLNSFQWGVGRGIGSPTGGSDREVSAPSVSEIVVTKSFDSSSVPLIREAFAGENAHVRADFVNQAAGKGKTYLKVELGHTLISSYSMSSGGDRPSESLSLNYTKISFTALDSKGERQKFKFDLTKFSTAATAQASTVSTAPAAASPASTDVAVDPIYMKYGDIKGDVTAVGYEGAAELNSFQWGMGRSIGRPIGAGGRREVSAPSVSEITVTKMLDSSSVPLIREAFIGDDAHVDVEFVNHFADRSETYIKVELENTLISSYSMSSGGDRPSESLSLNFTKLSISALDKNGQRQDFTYDLAKGASLVAAATAPAAVAAASQASPAALVDAGIDPIYMKYGDIKGDVTAEGFEDAIQLNSFRWGVGRGIGSPSGGSDREASAPSVSEIVVTKSFDSSSVPLIREAFIGTDTPVKLNFVNQFQDRAETYLKFELANTLVSGYSMSSGGDRPSESLSLNFTKISIAALDIKGETQEFTFDLAKQAGSLVAAAIALPAPAASPAPSLAAAAGDDPIYMKYGDIEGEVTAEGFEGAIELNSFQWGVGRGISSPIGGAGREASTPSVSEIVVTKSFDSSSVPLIREAFIGDAAHVDVDFVNSVEGVLQTYLSFDLENTLISGYSMSSGGDRPTESLSLNFTKITITALDRDGQAQTFEYDLEKGTVA